MRVVTLFLLLCPAFAETKFLKNFTLIDGTGKPAAANMAMIVTDGRVQSIASAGKIKAPAGAEVVDLTGKFVMPGIVNLHGHVGATVDMQQGAQLYSRENVERDLRTYASYGVTTVVSLGTDLDPVFAVRDGQRGTRPQMARLYTAGKGFTLKGGNPPAGGMRYEVATPAECEARVAELAAQKVDFVKIWVDDAFGKRQKMPIELSRAIIASAKQHGLRTVVHIVNLQDAKDVIEAGAAGIAHSVRDQEVDQAFIDLMKKHGAWQMAATLTRELSTFVYAESPKMLDDPFLTRSVSAKVIEIVRSPQYINRIKSDPEFPRYPDLLTMALKNLKRLADAGVKYGFGTDSGPPARFQGYFEQLELELMTAAGLTPMQVITAATKSSAEFLGARDLGTLERGTWADLIVLSKNPLEDIKNTRSIESVYIAGNKL
ncbi:MAG TPA: amidohydrolase family protein [Bryobacteraceae bacterium]|nr:amidohydrolase family protein [Bryobacteraceae bacterium]